MLCKNMSKTDRGPCPVCTGVEFSKKKKIFFLFCHNKQTSIKASNLLRCVGSKYNRTSHVRP